MEITAPAGNLNRLHIRTGMKCNNRCVFCVDGEKEKDAKVDWISLKKQIETELRENRLLRAVSFTTGEPTLNPFLPEFVSEAKRLGYRSISVVSNGRAWSDPSFCREMISAGLTNIVISIHGPDAETHDAITTIPGSFDEALRGLSNLCGAKNQSGFHLSTQTVINKMNAEIIGGMLGRFLPLAIDSMVFTPMEPRGNGLDRFTELAVPYTIIGEVFHNAAAEYGVALENRVKIEPAPFCIFKGMEFLVGRWNVVNVRDKDTGEIEVFRAEERHAQGPPCLGCARAESCPGVWRLYAETFGWAGFDPYIK